MAARKIISYSYIIASMQQQIYGMAADVAGTAGHENAFHWISRNNYRHTQSEPVERFHGYGKAMIRFEGSARGQRRMSNDASIKAAPALRASGRILRCIEFDFVIKQFISK